MPTLAEAIGHIRNSGDYSDLTLHCGDKVFEVHQAVVCTQSRKLRVDAMDNFPEYPLRKPEISIPSHEPHFLKAMIDYLYTQIYPQRILEEPTSEFPFNTKVFLISHEYGILGLRTLAAERLKREAANWRTSDTDPFLDALKLATQTQPWEEESGKCLVDCAATMGEFLMEDPSFIEYLKTNGDFAAHVLRVVMKDRKRERSEGLEVPETVQPKEKKRKFDSFSTPRGSPGQDEPPR